MWKWITSTVVLAILLAATLSFYIPTLLEDSPSDYSRNTVLKIRDEIEDVETWLEQNRDCETSSALWVEVSVATRLARATLTSYPAYPDDVQLEKVMGALERLSTAHQVLVYACD